MPLERYLSELADESKPIKHTGLGQLSDLAPEELDQFKAAWAGYSAQRRRQVISRLVSMAEENVDLDFSAIFKLSLKDEDEEVRESAVAGLWECEERSLITTFISLLRCDSSERVRAAAAQALGKFAMLAEVGKLLAKDGERIREALLEVAVPSSTPLQVRRRSLEAVAAFNHEKIRELVRRAYDQGEDELRQSAIYAMGRNSDPQWLPTILKELSSPNPTMRYEAASACGELGEEAAVPYLLPLLKDEDIQVQVSAIHALGAIGGSAARRALRACLRSPEPAVRDAAGEALETLGFSEDPIAFKSH